MLLGCTVRFTFEHMKQSSSIQSSVKGLFQSEGRIFGLDLLRFIAIVLVVLGHSRWMIQTFPKPIKIMLHGSGILGVELFFVLSGFLIGGILLKTYEKNGHFLKLSDIQEFWIRRWFRTLPNYFLILFVYLFLYWDSKPVDVWKYFLFIQNAFTYPPYFFEESWSLAIEEISYLISPLVLAVFTIIVGSFRPSNSWWFFWMSLLLIALITLLRYYFSATKLPIYMDMPGYSWQYKLREVALIRLDSIYYGFVAVFLSRRFSKEWVQSKYITAIVGLTGVLLLMAFTGPILEQNTNNFKNTIFFSLLSISIGLILPYLSEMRNAPIKALAAPITFISIISYSMYLINGGILSWQMKMYFEDGKDMSTLQLTGIYALYWILCLGLSALIFVLYEKPFTSLRERFSSK